MFPHKISLVFNRFCRIRWNKLINQPKYNTVLKTTTERYEYTIFIITVVITNVKG